MWIVRLNTVARSAFHWLSLFTLAVLAASSSQAQTFTNAGFEQPAIGPGSWVPQPDGFSWTGAFNYGVANGNGSWGTGAHSGDQYAFIESDGIDFPNQQAWMEQSVDGFQIGQEYQITFWMAQRNGDVGGNTSNPIYMTMNHSVLLFPPTVTTDVNWELFATDTFTATQTSNTFRLTSVQTFTDSSNLFDDFRIVPVPEPATALVLVVGWLGFSRRRRKRS